MPFVSHATHSSHVDETVCVESDIWKNWMGLDAQDLPGLNLISARPLVVVPSGNISI